MLERMSRKFHKNRNTDNRTYDYSSQIALLYFPTLFFNIVLLYTPWPFQSS